MSSSPRPAGESHRRKRGSQHQTCPAGAAAPRAAATSKRPATRPDRMPSGKVQFLRGECVSFERGITQHHGGPHRDQVLRRESRPPPARADADEPHRPAKQRGKRDTGARDLPAAFAMGVVHHQHFTLSEAGINLAGHDARLTAWLSPWIPSWHFRALAGLHRSGFRSCPTGPYLLVTIRGTDAHRCGRKGRAPVPIPGEWKALWFGLSTSAARLEQRGSSSQRSVTTLRRSRPRPTPSGLP
jgi:hypothetical protein